MMPYRKTLKMTPSITGPYLESIRSSVNMPISNKIRHRIMCVRGCSGRSHISEGKYKVRNSVTANVDERDRS